MDTATTVDAEALTGMDTVHCCSKPGFIPERVYVSPKTDREVVS